jgi:hypothetical protein
MLQRIQSLYLSAALLLLVCYVFVPIATFYSAGYEYVIRAVGIFYIENNVEIFDAPNMATGVVMILTLLTLGTTIFMYKNRPMQIKMCTLGIILIFVTLGLNVFAMYDIPRYITQGVTPALSFTVWLALPAISIILVILAQRHIRKDEDLIKSMDRLR